MIGDSVKTLEFAQLFSKVVIYIRQYFMAGLIIVVVLPAPLEPSKPNISPALTLNVSASTAVNPPKLRERLLIFNTASLMCNTGYIPSWMQ